MLLSSQSVLGYGQESYWGNVTSASTYFPVNPLQAMDQVKYRKIRSQTRVTGTVLNVPTFAGGKISTTHFATKATVLDELRAAFGSESVSSTAHTFSVADIPSSYTITEHDGEYTRAYAGARLEQWTVTFDVENGLKCQSQWWSQMAQSISWSGPTVPIDTPPDVQNGVISIGGSQIGSVVSGKWSFQRAIKLIHSDQVQDVVGIHPGPLIVEADLILAIEDNAAWDKMRNGTPDSLTTTFDWLSITSYKTNYEQVQMQRGNALLTQQIKFRSVYSDVDDAMVSASVTV